MRLFTLSAAAVMMVFAAWCRKRHKIKRRLLPPLA
jgi:hypothetical protein